MPNQRRRRLSTTMSAVAALAVASPFAIAAFSGLAADGAGPQQREFVPAASMDDLPNELISALSQGLSQFGVNMPPMPGASDPMTSSALTSPGLTSPGLTSPGLTDPGLTSPGLTTGGLTSPGLTSPGLTSPGLTSPGLTSPSLTSPGLTSPGLTDAGLSTPGLTDPALSPGLGGDELGLDPGLDGTYPILGDPALGAMPATTNQGGLVSDLMSAANQLGAGQAFDLLKGVMSQAVTAGPAAAGAAPAAAAPAAEAAAAPVIDAAAAAG